MSSELSNKIKAEALRLGFFAWGIAKAEPVDVATQRQIREWLDVGGHADMAYMLNHEDKRLNPLLLMDGVKSIGIWAFANCRGLSSVTIPDSVKSIGDGAFYNCSGLTDVTFNGRTMAQVKEMANYSWGINNTSIIHVA